MRDSSRLIIPRSPQAEETNRQLAMLRWAKEQAARPGHEVIEIPDHFDHDEAMVALELAIIAEHRRAAPIPESCPPVFLPGQGRTHADSLSQGVVCGVFVAGILMFLAAYLLSR